MSATVSIIIPCYNQARFLGDALDSALAQDYSAVEIVVVNDGSTDDFDARRAPYQDNPRIKFITQENRGLPAARNRGIGESAGEYLKFLDADDWLAREVISKQLAAFARHPATGFVYCDFARVRADGQTDDYSVTRARRVLDGDILPSLLVGGYFTPHTVLVPRRVLDRVGMFDESLGGTADTELWMRIVCENYAAQYVPEKLVYYRLHDANMSHDTGHMRATHRAALDAIVTRYPHRVASALDELIHATRRADAGAEWARAAMAAQQEQIESLQRALDTRGVRLVRAVERRFKHD
jgi:glycosyltransferase involved in cell wall biosynthesis